MIVDLKSLAAGRRTMADFVADLGGIPLERIRLKPPIGAATVADVETHKCCELVDGALVEKAMGFREAFLATFISRIIGQFVEEHDLGLVVGADGPWRLKVELVRIPDVAFVSWERLPGDEAPEEPVPAIAPNLAVEVLSAGNTPAEMKRKIAEYFDAGVSLVWIVDRFSNTITVHKSKTKKTVLDRTDSLDGGKVLPGFSLSVDQVFASIEKKRPRKL